MDYLPEITRVYIFFGSDSIYKEASGKIEMQRASATKTWQLLTISQKKSPNGEKSIRHIADEESRASAVVVEEDHNDDLHDNGGVKFKAPRAEFVPQIRWITKQNRLDARPVIILFWWWRVVARVIYDRVLNEKNNFEIPLFYV